MVDALMLMVKLFCLSFTQNTKMIFFAYIPIFVALAILVSELNRGAK